MYTNFGSPITSIAALNLAVRVEVNECFRGYKKNKWKITIDHQRITLGKHKTLIQRNPNENTAVLQMHYPTVS